MIETSAWVPSQRASSAPSCSSNAYATRKTLKISSAIWASASSSARSNSKRTCTPRETGSGRVRTSGGAGSIGGASPTHSTTPSTRQRPPGTGTRSIASKCERSSSSETPRTVAVPTSAPTHALCTSGAWPTNRSPMTSRAARARASLSGASLRKRRRWSWAASGVVSSSCGSGAFTRRPQRECPATRCDRRWRSPRP